MNNRKIMIAFGTRPEAIKMCPLVRELRSREGIEATVLLSGQHKDMTGSVMDFFGVKADICLERRESSLSGLVSEVMQSGEQAIEQVRPDIILVHGDTATALGMGLAGFFSRVRVGHVEAGLRSGDMSAPFPEELDRRALSLCASIHFAPTQRAATCLMEEGIKSSCVHVTGNTVIDALKYTLRADYKNPLLEECEGKRIIFLTAHRRESHGRTLEGIFGAVKRICREHEDIRVIFPVHPCKTVFEAAHSVLGECEAVKLCPPLDVLDCHNIIAHSHLVLTDSGGLQEEAAALGKPVLVMRNVTERPEGIVAGIARLAGTDPEQIFATVSDVLTNPRKYRRMARAQNPYGDGDACKKIADILCK